MSDDNHYRYMREHIYTEPTIGWARKMAERHRWKALPTWLSEATAAKMTREQSMMEGSNLLYATVEKYARELHETNGGWSFYDFISSKEAMQFAAVLGEPGLGRAFTTPAKAASVEATMMIKQVWHEVVMNLTGEHVYDVSPGLGEKLAHTELRGVSTDDLKLPFDSVYVVVPKRAGLQVWNDETGWHQIAGIYVVDDPARFKDGDIPHKVFHPSWDVAKGMERCWRFLVWGKSKSQDPLDDALFHFVFYLPPGKSVDEQIEVEHERNRREDLTVVGFESPDTIQFYREHWRTIFQWVMNVAIYSTWPEADVEHVIANPEAQALWERHTRAPKGSKKRAALLQRFRDIPYVDRRVVLGRHVAVLDPQVQVEHGTGKPLAVRTLVCGHWQRYAHGKGRTERQWHWRQPFWRGPKDAPVSSPEHKVV